HVAGFLDHPPDSGVHLFFERFQRLDRVGRDWRAVIDPAIDSSLGDAADRGGLADQEPERPAARVEPCAGHDLAASRTVMGRESSGAGLNSPVAGRSGWDLSFLSR